MSLNFEADMPIFFNLSEFAKEYTIEGKRVKAVIDADNSKDTIAPDSPDEGYIRLHVQSEDVSPDLQSGGTMEIDDMLYSVVSRDNSEGVSIFLLLRRYDGHL